jgi:hypothetical protein
MDISRSRPPGLACQLYVSSRTASSLVCGRPYAIFARTEPEKRKSWSTAGAVARRNSARSSSSTGRPPTSTTAASAATRRSTSASSVLLALSVAPTTASAVLGLTSMSTPGRAMRPARRNIGTACVGDRELEPPYAYRSRYNEVAEWYKREGFDVVTLQSPSVYLELFGRPICGAGMTGRRRAGERAGIAVALATSEHAVPAG